MFVLFEFRKNTVEKKEQTIKRALFFFVFFCLFKLLFLLILLLQVRQVGLKYSKEQAGAFITHLFPFLPENKTVIKQAQEIVASLTSTDPFIVHRYVDRKEQNHLSPH